MAIAFADASYYIALLLPSDELHRRAARLANMWHDRQVVTSDLVFVEILAHVSGLGSVSRREAVELIHALREDDFITIVRQTPELFDRGLDLYERRLDKGWSLTDCVSMTICRDMDITDVLTHDHHFAQGGFQVLL